MTKRAEAEKQRRTKMKQARVLLANQQSECSPESKRILAANVSTVKERRLRQCLFDVDCRDDD